jgi:enoyl-CoA hydratase/carnithine racemase
MAALGNYHDLGVDVDAGNHVATLEIRRPPNNFFDLPLVNAIGDALRDLDAVDDCRAIVLCSQGKHFCAGNDFSSPETDVTNTQGPGQNPLYAAGVRMFMSRKPIVAAVQGAAIGGGLGIAMACDFRVAAPEARFSANFAQLGFHHGFGLTLTLPRTCGAQRADLLLLTGRRVGGEEALALGLCDDVAPLADVRARATALAAEIAAAAPLAVQSIRATLRGHLADAYARITVHESAEQARLRRTDDFREGVAAVAARRPARFTGR